MIAMYNLSLATGGRVPDLPAMKPVIALTVGTQGRVLAFFWIGCEVVGAIFLPILEM